MNMEYHVLSTNTEQNTGREIVNMEDHVLGRNTGRRTGREMIWVRL